MGSNLPLILWALVITTPTAIGRAVARRFRPKP